MNPEKTSTEPSNLNERDAGIRTLGIFGKKTCTLLISLLVISLLVFPWIPQTYSGFEKLKGFFSEAEFHNGWFKIKAGIALTWGSLGLLLMRMVFARFAEGKVLCTYNARSIRWMGIFCFATLIVNQIVLRSDATSAQRIENLFEPEVLEGAFLLALGWAFEKAVKLKEENDLTV